MPEGHTIHRLARDFNKAFAPGPVHTTSPQGRFAAGADLLNGRELLEAQAVGKHLFVEFSGEQYLHVHLGLIGYFSLNTRPAGDPVVGQVRLRISGLTYVADLRGPYLCNVVTGAEIDTVINRLGPDPLRPDADPEKAWAKIRRSKKSIAELLMDQNVLAGVGNVYRAEVLHRNRINPFTPGTSLKRASWDILWADLVRLLEIGVATTRIVTIPDQVAEIEARMARGENVDLDSRDSAIYRHADSPCPECGSKVRTKVLAGRNLFWCGNCQRRS